MSLERFLKLLHDPYRKREDAKMKESPIFYLQGMLITCKTTEYLRA